MEQLLFFLLIWIGGASVHTWVELRPSCTNSHTPVKKARKAQQQRTIENGAKRYE